MSHCSVCVSQMQVKGWMIASAQFCEEVCCFMCFFLKWSLIIMVMGEQKIHGVLFARKQ